jgi:RimJ/RimL family protein N-acetyltransferase
MMLVKPVTLEGETVRLEPLRLLHSAALFSISNDESIWRYLLSPQPRTRAEMDDFITKALQAQEAGQQLPFAIIEQASGRVIGSTRYLTIMPHDHGLEIGSTWLAAPFRRTRVNTECKYLLLRHAFEVLHAIRVQFKTDSRNVISQAAIERLGAQKEGVLRNHMITHDGYYRHSVYYSIIESEWPTVKTRLEAFLAR